MSIQDPHQKCVHACSSINDVSSSTVPVHNLSPGKPFLPDSDHDGEVSRFEIGNYYPSCTELDVKLNTI